MHPVKGAFRHLSSQHNMAMDLSKLIHYNEFGLFTMKKSSGSHERKSRHLQTIKIKNMLLMRLIHVVENKTAQYTML